MILVTGGAGFIGSNFVLDWLSQWNEGIINVDLLTYAGSLENLDGVKGEERHIFVQDDIGNSALVANLRLMQPLVKNGYAQYLMRLLQEWVVT
jgi:dTDP-glucose 4,6-dehydratase